MYYVYVHGRVADANVATNMLMLRAEQAIALFCGSNVILLGFWFLTFLRVWVGGFLFVLQML